MLLVLRPADGSDAEEVSEATGLFCEGRGRTKQEFLEECDINTILKRFGLGYEPPMNVHVPMTGDFTDALDFRDSLDLIREADEAFMLMSADTRARFGNDAAAFVDFVSETKDGKLANIDEMRKLGLAVPEVVPVPERVVKVEVVAPPGGAPKAP